METTSTTELKQMNENLGAQVGDLVRRRHELERRLRQSEQEAAELRAQLERARAELRAERERFDAQLAGCLRSAGELIAHLDVLAMHVAGGLRRAGELVAPLEEIQRARASAGGAA